MQITELLAKQDTEVEILELYQYDIKDCIGCDCCILKGNCVLTDDVCEVMDTLANADGIILASPVYLQQVSGKIKTFFDRTCRWYHRPALTGKPVLCVATTKGSGLRATLSYLENVAIQWGAIPAACVGRTIFNLSKAVSMPEIARFVRLLNQPETYAPTLHQLVDFEVQKSLSQFLSGLDSQYWAEKGWMSAPYFYPCRVNKIKSAISGLVGKTMRKNMAKRSSSKEAVTQPEHDDRRP